MIERRDEGAFRRWFRLVLNTIMLIVILHGVLKTAHIFIAHPLVQLAKVTRAAFELQQITTAVESEELLDGSYPEDFAQFMRENFRRRRGPDVTMDPWGRPYGFENKEQDFTVYSAGPDGVPRTKDDILITRKKERYL